MSLPPPLQNPDLLGHDAALAAFEASRKSGRLHHAWLIAGDEGIGKATLAAHFALSVLSEGALKAGSIDTSHPIARLVAAETHPDLFLLRRDVDEKTGAPKNSIAVEKARKIAPFLRLTPTHGKWRVALIDEAHLLNRFGQNTILKVIEEPPPNCLILMTVTTPGVLLPTIRSRCRLLPLDPLQPAIMEELLQRSGASIEGPERARLLTLADGSFGLALRMLETDAVALFDLLCTALEEGDLPAFHTLADRLSKRGEAAAFPVISGLMLSSLSRALRPLAEGAPLPSDLPRFYKGLSLDRGLVLWDKLKEIFSDVDRANLDRKLGLLIAFRAVRHALNA